MQIHSLVDMPKFETQEKAFEENQVRIRILRRVGGICNLELANRLEVCGWDDKPCKSLACKRCNRDFRITKVDTLVDKITADPRDWWAITYIDYQQALTDQEFGELDVQKSKDRIRQMLKRAGFEGPIIGCFEIDFHSICRLWLPHFHLLCPVSKQNLDAEYELKQKLRKQVESGQIQHIKSERAARPLKFDLIKDHYDQISYVYKLDCYEVYDIFSRTKGKYIPYKKRLTHERFCAALCLLDGMNRRGIQFSYGERGW